MSLNLKFNNPIFKSFFLETKLIYWRAQKPFCTKGAFFISFKNIKKIKQKSTSIGDNVKKNLKNDENFGVFVVIVFFLSNLF